MDASETDSRNGLHMAQLTHDHAAWLNASSHEAPPKRYRIGELARHTGLTRQTLHNYTRWGLIQEAEWTPGGHRLYDEAVFTRLSKILRLRKGHTVEEIKRLLDGPAVNVAPQGVDQSKDDPSVDVGGN